MSLFDFQRLTDAEWRRSHEAQHGIFVAEGEKVIRRAFELGYRPRRVLTTAKWLPGLLAGLLAAASVEVVASERLAEITGYQVHRGALASFERPPARDWRASTSGPGPLLLLEDLVDLANLGVVFRSGAGLGAAGVLLSPGCADPLYRRAIKTSMAATLRLPFARYPSTTELGQQLRADGWQLVALTPRGAHRLPDIGDLEPNRTVLALGSEGPGLSEAVLAMADYRVALPMHQGVDSINVAAAATVALWEINGRGLDQAGSNRP